MPGRREWLWGGAVATTVLSSVLFMGNGPSVLRPMPVHQVVLALVMGGAFVFVLPVIYLVTLAYLWERRSFAQVSLAASLVVAGLSVVWFVNSWEFGISYQGVGHTVAVAALNAVAIVAAVALALVGWRRQLRQMQASAYLTVFVVLSWCAFPFLGEPP
jgi:hypothetical protein